jgi:hypothetical protein
MSASNSPKLCVRAVDRVVRECACRSGGWGRRPTDRIRRTPARVAECALSDLDAENASELVVGQPTSTNVFDYIEVVRSILVNRDTSVMREKR